MGSTGSWEWCGGVSGVVKDFLCVCLRGGVEEWQGTRESRHLLRTHIVKVEC